MQTKISRRQLLAGAAATGGIGLAASMGLNPLAALAQEAALGRDLIGNLEGPEIVTDTALWPTAFRQAPTFDALVASGALPPVEQRVPAEPLVVRPVHEIGTYGGNIRHGFTGPGDVWNAWRAVSGPDHVLFWDYTGGKIVPNVAKGWEVSQDGKTTTIFLRKGMKWSDGAPFTADAFVFWFEDIYSNRDLVRFPTGYFSAGGEQGKVVRVDDHTVQFVFAHPNYLLPEIMAGTSDLAGHAMQGRIGLGLFAPGHYLKQFHPKYADQATIDALAKENNFETWVQLFLQRNNWTINPELPSVTPWVLKSAINQPVMEFERNPYSMWVDTEGNQLPYVDKVSFTLAENLEVLNLRAIAGEYDFQARHIDIGKLPVLVRNQADNDYKVYLDTGEYGTDMFIGFNHTFKADPEIAKWFTTTDFRRALSMGIDRDEMNEVFWLGMGTPRTIVPADTNFYNPGPEYSRMWAEYKPDEASALLDQIGLLAKDADGYRLRTDGKGRLSLELMTFGGSAMPYPQMAEMVREHLRRIGIDIIVNESERSLGESRIAANEHQMFSWVGDGTEHLYSFGHNALPLLTNSWQGPLWGQWWATNGKEGEEPVAWMRQALDNYRRAPGVPPEERVALSKEIWSLLVDNVHFIGTVGLSPAFMGIRMASNRLGNIPARQFNSPDVKNHSISQPTTFYFKA